jgi:thioredoxin reductase (NADPH)
MFFVDTSNGSYRTRRCVIAIGILDKPNKPDYPIPFTLKGRVHFDITSVEIKNQDCLVVGGGDTAAEYCQYLVQQGNGVTLSYRRTEFSRLNRVNHESLMAMEERRQVQILRGSNISKLSDEEGRPRVSFLETELPARVFDHIIYSLGGTTPTNFLKITVNRSVVLSPPALVMLAALAR